MLRGLAREDLFTVVHDQVMTDTARFADVVLPATTHFEADDVAVSYGTYVLQTVPAVIDRVGESRTNNELAAALAARLGLDPAEFDPDPAVLLARMTAGAGRAGAGAARAGATVQFVDTFPTFADAPGPSPRRRRRASAPALPPTRLRPLHAHQPGDSEDDQQHLREFDPPPAVPSMNPTMRRARIVDDAIVRAWNDQATLELPCRIDASLRPSVCAIPKGCGSPRCPAD